MLNTLTSYRAKFAKSMQLWRAVVTLLSYSSKRYGIIVFILTVLEIVFTLGAFYAVKMVVDIMGQPTGIREDAAALFGSMTLILVLFLSGRIMQSIANYYRAAQGYVVSDYVNQAIQERAVAADLAFYDSALYFDSLERARQAGAQRPAIVIGNALSVFRGALMLGAIIVVLGSIEWRLLPVSLMAVLLILAVQVRFTRERFDRQRQLVQKERRAGYADWLMTSETFAKEIRLWNLGAYLRHLYMEVRIAVRHDYLAIERRKSISEILVSVVGTLLFIGSGGFLLYQVSIGVSTVSQLIMLILLLQRGEAAGRDMVSSLSRLYDDQLFLNQLFMFLKLQPMMKTPETVLAVPEEITEGVRLNNVSFHYPSSEKMALDNVSLHLQPGKFTALVGGNGSGKTTLIKLLCRLYDPSAGSVTYDGVDIRKFDPVTYRQRFSVIFQDFVQFAYSARDNIRLADLARGDDETALYNAARLSGAHEVLEVLPNGYDTMLSRMFDGGVALSGGQWQKVALARAMFPKSKFIILDEPTSAIDPNAEAELFDKFREKMEGRGALVISHRLSTIRQADYTYVLHEGRIVEEGSHEDLIALDGQYAQMFKRQGRGYRV